MYMCVKRIDYVPSQTFGRSCMCVKGVDYIPSQTLGQSCICVLKVSILYQARRLDGHVYVY